MNQLIIEATKPEHFNKKAKDRLFEYAVFYEDKQIIQQLAALKYPAAAPERFEQEKAKVMLNLTGIYKNDNLKTLEPLIKKYGVDFKNPLNTTPIFLAFAFGSEQILNFLLKNNANISTTDFFGRNVLQVLLSSSLLPSKKQKNIQLLRRYYNILKNESIKLKIADKLVKIDSHQAEYLMFHFMLASTNVFFEQFGAYNVADRVGTKNVYNPPYFESFDFNHFFSEFGEQVVRKYRQQRTYISSILSKNEIYSTNPYGKQLFWRVEHGKYLLNPILEIQIEESWVPIKKIIDYEQNIKMSLDRIHKSGYRMPYAVFTLEQLNHHLKSVENSLSKNGEGRKEQNT